MEAMDGEMAKLVANRGASHATHKETGFGAHRSPLTARRLPLTDSLSTSSPTPS